MKHSGEPGGLRSRVVVAGVTALTLTFGFGAWAYHAPMGGAVIAQGKVAVRSQVKLIQHRDGGIVSEILVQNGDYVHSGDVLIRLDETQTRAELGVLQTQIAEALGRKARLTAERDGDDAVVFDVSLASATNGAAVMSGESRLFRENRSVREARREQLSAQIEQLEEQIRGMAAQQASNESERIIVKEDLARLAPLYERKFIEIAKLRATERDLVKVEGLKGEISANIARVRSQISETRIKVIELDQQVRTDSQRDLRDLEGRINELSERLIAARDKLSRMSLTAPCNGYVNDLSVHTINGVVSPKENLMTIVPDDTELVVEARLAPADIDQVAVGQLARMRFTAFNQRTTPEVQGAVATIGAASTADPATGQSYYLSTIALKDNLRTVENRPVVPGMPVEVFLSTGERSALSYLIKPFSDQMARAMRER
ncbi:HlyD family type I secretion periplasmic adaptor subunit [Alsobacter metallidurans]|nr:HlyD family type I secretion periplasmic adaptor subunit [Alsobacter metallidurans]